MEDLPTIPDEGCVRLVERRCDACWLSCRSFYQHYKAWIIGCILILIVGLIVIIAVVTQKTYNLPCIAYAPNTLASSVSVPCLQYVWDQNCATKAPYTFPATYDGWWIRSPQGSTMISCRTSQSCGVGSYGNLVIYMGLCNLYYNQ